MGNASQQSQDETEAMKQRRRTTENICWCEAHSVTNETWVIHEVTVEGEQWVPDFSLADNYESQKRQGGNLLMCQHWCFGIPSWSTRELQITDIVGTDQIRLSVELVKGYRRTLENNIFVGLQILILTPYNYDMLQKRKTFGCVPWTQLLQRFLQWTSSDFGSNEEDFTACSRFQVPIWSASKGKKGGNTV